MKDELVQLLLNNVNLQGLAVGLLDDIIKAKLQEVVDDTSNPYDNMLVDALYPMVREKVLEEIADLLAALQPPVQP